MNLLTVLISFLKQRLGTETKLYKHFESTTVGQKFQ